MNFKSIKDFFKKIKLKKQNINLNNTNTEVSFKKIPIIKQLKK
jgi:hypothetical protein